MCDLNYAADTTIGHAQPSSGQQQPTTTTTTNPTNVENTGQTLSKLVLSTSLHQLADSKYHTNYTKNNSTTTTDQMNATTTAGTQNSLSKLLNTNTNTNTNTNAADSPPCQQNTNANHQQPTLPHETATQNLTQLQTTTTTTTTTCQNTSNNNINNTPGHGSPPPPINSTNKRNNNNISHVKREANLDTVHVVVGNESCDLDSAVSCLLMFHIISKMSDEINGKDKTRTLYIPLLNTTRDALDSKCEVLWFLQKTLNIDKSFLTCKDDIDWNEIKKNGVEVLVTLVDHNYNDEFKNIGKIVEIIDHHQVQNPEWLMDNHASIRLTLDTSVGSCTTLVAERLFYIYAEHHVSDEILLLIYGTVLLDTICLSEKAKRFTRRDVYLLKKLDTLLGSKRPIRDELYKQLVEVKNSTRELNFEKLMKRDLKVYKDRNGLRVGIASLFGMAAKEALGLAANINLDTFFSQNQYEAFVIMGLIADLDHSDSISRDLVLISANESLFNRLCDAFERDTSRLDLTTTAGNSSQLSPDPEDTNIHLSSSATHTKSPTRAQQTAISRTGGGSGSSSSNNSGNSGPQATTTSPSASSSKTDATSGGNANSTYKTRIWLQRNVTSSRKVVAPLVLKVLHDGATTGSEQI